MADVRPESSVRTHYRVSGVAARALAALAAQGIEEPAPSDLAPVDQLHTGGIRATRELASLLELRPGDRVLDLGCGLGGPARCIAFEFGCTVVAVDLVRDLLREGRVLTSACGLLDRIQFVAGTALRLPFRDESFDAVCTQHVVMNIADRLNFWREAARVLRRGGRFGSFDIVRGPNPAPLTFPLPWASRAEISFVLTPEETRVGMEEAGFEIERWEQPEPPPVTVPAARGLDQRMALGEEIGERIANVGAAYADGRLALLRVLARRQR
ncbi:Demethylrebeccamycin-D-glucose O-methyltransferase [bacterium HR29]|jgi:ubiquinone/menaquinone biosynthesis C-methylase UbiE|nr:Demethylrebeccamycin-D-glucose O-methyltransferase [bacterium HR29]